MRANHATKPQEPAPRGGTGARRGIARCLPRPRTAAAAGALIAQLWGFGAPMAHAAAVDPLRDPVQPAVRRALHGAPALDRPILDGPALDGQSAALPVGPGQAAGGGPLDGVTGAVGDTLQDRIRAGGLPLPGQRAAVPDAFALASGLLGGLPAQARATETHTSRESGQADPHSAGERRIGLGRPTAPRQDEAEQASSTQEAAPAAVIEAGPAAEPDRATDATAAAAPGDGGTPETVAIADTAAATASTDDSATATAVLAPIAAGLLLTGAAMCKHRGLPRGH
ncbi:hypothetical protein [Kitasatospora brasiliensis]|uniref:hypothetical protein n=1 Tax=Kitasatospora brasiliensis TaxID=3058040 RepID=UPI00292FB650|nr:hypothetical protein [Kitasatospora sp. K002]